MDWSLYDNGLRHERVQKRKGMTSKIVDNDVVTIYYIIFDFPI